MVGRCIGPDEPKGRRRSSRASFVVTRSRSASAAGALPHEPTAVAAVSHAAADRLDLDVAGTVPLSITDKTSPGASLITVVCQTEFCHTYRNVTHDSSMSRKVLTNTCVCNLATTRLGRRRRGGAQDHRQDQRKHVTHCVSHQLLLAEMELGHIFKNSGLTPGQNDDPVTRT